MVLDATLHCRPIWPPISHPATCLRELVGRMGGTQQPMPPAPIYLYGLPYLGVLKTVWGGRLKAHNLELWVRYGEPGPQWFDSIRRVLSMFTMPL